MPSRARGKHEGGLATTRESVMELRSQSDRIIRKARPMVPCAQCGDTLFAPEWSEYLDERSVRHLWSCDVCGYRFESMVRYPEPHERAA
jgi:ribosomal protein L37AE/L43A